MTTRWRRSLEAARAQLGRSVVALAPGADAAEPGDDVLRLGVKDTAAITEALRRKLAAEPGLAWLTVDRAAPGGIRRPVYGRRRTPRLTGRSQVQARFG